MAIEASDVLAGPILRRVDRNQVAVQVVLAKEASAQLRVFRNLGPGSAGELVGETTPAPTLKVGGGLHFALLVLDLPAGSELTPESLFSYDVVLDGRGLGALGFLRDGEINGHPHKALGFVTDALPGFATPPTDPIDLAIAHGSCRNFDADGRDTMAALDGIILDARTDPKRRLHLLVLTGDQIYADEVPPELLLHATKLGATLLAEPEQLPVNLTGRVGLFDVTPENFPPARRQRLIIRGAKFTSNAANSHVLGFGEYVALYLLHWCNVTWPKLEPMRADRQERVRKYLDRYIAKRTAAKAKASQKEPSAGDKSTLAEMLHHYPALELLPPEARKIDAHLEDKDLQEQWEPKKTWEDFWGAPDFPERPSPRVATPDPDKAELAKLLTPAHYAALRHYRVVLHGTDDDALNPERNDSTRAEDQKIGGDSVLNRFVRYTEVYRGLPSVRRALANVPSLMLFDDHEVTDDWNIHRKWVDDTNRSELGRAVIRNALVAYGLFQDWGNKPRDYATDGTTHAKLLTLVKEKFWRGGNTSDAAKQLDRLFGLPLITTTNGVTTPGAEVPERDRITWNFVISGNGYEIIGLDNRTRRGFSSLIRPPENIHAQGIIDQVPRDPGFSGAQGVTYVIAPMPVLGFPPIESMGQPFINILTAFRSGPERASQPFKDAKADYMAGRLVRDPEPWGHAPQALERLLGRLASRKRVLFLSGDVHYSVTVKMHYERRVDGAPVSTRFVQLTSSALKNQQGATMQMLAHQGLAQELAIVLSGDITRYFWGQLPALPTPTELPGHPEPDPTPRVDEHPLKSLGPRLNATVQRSLSENPSMVPLSALPRDPADPEKLLVCQVIEPDWAWRAQMVEDVRSDVERFAGKLAAPDLPTDAEVASDPIRAASRVAARHFWQNREAPPRSLHLITAVGVVRLVRDDDGKEHVRHEMWSHDLAGTHKNAHPYTILEVPLDPGEDEAITRLPVCE